MRVAGQRRTVRSEGQALADETDSPAPPQEGAPPTMSTTYAVTVTIGRNIPTRHRDAACEDGLAEASTHYPRYLQLTPQAWQAYTEQVEEALETYVDDIETHSWWLETHDGVGAWEGVVEESRKITLLFETPNGLPQSARENLVLDLLRARTAYYQDAVALSFGESVLV